jgi:CHAT domain-containing protein
MSRNFQPICALAAAAFVIMCCAVCAPGRQSLVSPEACDERDPALMQALFRDATDEMATDEMATCLAVLGERRLMKGDYARAEQFFRRALALREATQGESHPELTTTLTHMARLRLAQQRLTETLQLFERAFTLSEEHLRREVSGFSEASLASTLQRLHGEEERLYALARRHPDDVRVRHLALSAALLRKGRSVEELSSMSRIVYRGITDMADLDNFERLRDLRTQIVMMSYASSGEPPSTEHQQRLKDLTRQAGTIEAALTRRSAEMRAGEVLPAPSQIVNRVRKALPRNSALIELIAYHDEPLIPEPGARPSHSPSELQYLALLLFADGRTHAVDLGPADPIDQAVLRLHEVLSDTFDYQPAAQELYQLTFQRLAPLLGDTRRLFLSTDGQLALIPFAALHDGSRSLIDDFDITYLTSGRDLLPRSNALLLPSSVVVLADPDFGALPDTAADQRSSPDRSALLERVFSQMRSDVLDRPWPQLPDTRKEAEAIHRRFPHAQLLAGRAATKDALLHLVTPGILHIATHGFFLEDASSPRGSRGVQTAGAVSDAGPKQRPADPLLRSGIVLTGAQAPAGGPGAHRAESSFVTALELAGLNLWGTQLVVLSACETGRGDIKLGQGVYGLRRALVVAGAETLVTSLWKVNDKTTRELMESYYDNLLTGQGRGEALRTAMLALRQKHPHPYFWAPFIAIGRDEPLQRLTPPTRKQPTASSKPPIQAGCSSTGSCSDPVASTAARPIPTSGLKLWLSADSGVSTSSSRERVSEWQDRSGNGLHASMRTPSRQPSLIPDAINGLPVIRFDGTQSLILANVLRLSDMTLFIVARNNQPSESFHMILGPANSSPNNQLRFQDGSKVLFVGTGNNMPVVTPTVGNTGMYHALSARYAGSTLKVYRDGSFVSSHSFTTIGPWDLLQIGAWYSQHFLLGDIAEIVAYDRALTDNERESVNSYLRKKYALP